MNVQIRDVYCIEAKDSQSRIQGRQNELVLFIVVTWVLGYLYFYFAFLIQYATRS